MQIIIDGDGCPVKDEAITVAEDFGLDLVIVTSISHFTNQSYPDHVSVVYVDTGKEMADYRIFQLVDKNDLVITQDYGLASLVLNKAYVMHHSGKVFDQSNIDQLLQQRHLGQQMRKANQRTKGPKPFTDENSRQFVTKLAQFLTDHSNQME